MTELHALDVPTDVSDRIRRRARAALSEHTDRGVGSRMERVAARWIELPLVGVFAPGVLVWAVAVVFGATP